MSVPAVASDAAVLVTARSAERLIVVWLVELSLVWSGSLVALVPICAVLARSEPSAYVEAMWKVSDQLVEAPLASPELVHVTVPALMAQPGEALTKVVFAGTASVTVKPALSLGPLFFTEIVYARSVPAVAVDGPVFVTCRSAEVCTVV